MTTAREIMTPHPGLGSSNGEDLVDALSVDY
jgi:hypothetical protein